MEEIKLNYSLKRRWKMLIIYFLVATFCIRTVILMFETGNFRIATGIFLIVAGVFSILFILSLLYQILSKDKTGLILNASGIKSNLSNGTKTGLVEWSNIAGIGLYEEGRRQHIAILAKDNTRYTLSGKEEKLLKERNICLLIPINEFDKNKAELKALIETYFNHYSSI